MRLHLSSKVERLFDALADVVAEPLASPFAAEVVVVPSRAMGEWLGLRLAEKRGVWANPRFVTVGGLVRELAGPAPEPADADAWEGDALAWAIAAVLPALLPRVELAPVAAYLEGDADGTKRQALARQLASTFRRYLVHRPAMVLAWERGERGARDSRGDRGTAAEHAWQPVVWRALVTKLGGEHAARRVDRWIATLRAREVRNLPERICVFAPEGLPRAHVELLAALGANAPVHVFARSSVDHPLHASLGARDAWMHALLGASSTAGLLDEGAAPPSLPAHLAVHACHGPMRECEVLRDQILAALNDDPTLEPRDVLVLCPDLETYAPVIDAVFGVPESTKTFLPYRVVDRVSPRHLRVVDGFLALLDLAPSRLAAPDVVDFLAREPVRARFGLEENELELVRRWVSEAGIRWGEDEAHREEEGQPRLRANTWRFGLDRLVVGYAMGKDGSHDRTLCEGTLPYDDVEGHATSTLGGLAAFCEALFTRRKELRGRRTLAGWAEVLRGALAAMFEATWKTEPQHRMVREALNGPTGLVASAARAGFDEEVPLAVVRDALAAELGERGRRMDVAAGGITFAAFGSARVVPARVVVLLGMNDGDVPRAVRAADFDLLAAKPEAGDPSVRDDDRQAFLDALLSARERLLITYVGQSIATNASLPPSVLVSELLDLLAPEELETAVVRHALHAFSPVYFTGADPRLFSHDPALCEAAKAKRGAQEDAEPFLRAPLPPSDLPRTLTLDQLARFFEHPVRAFMQTRLRVAFGSDAEVLEDREPLELDALDAWKVGAGLLERGEEAGDVPADLVAEGVLPLGVVGVFAYADVAKKVAWIRAQVTEHAGSAPRRAPIPIELDVPEEDTRIVGWVKDATTSVCLTVTYSSLGAKHRIGAWVRHVVMNAAGHGLRTVLVCKDDVWQLAPMPRAEAQAELRDLVSLYWRGLEAPLLFFPGTSLAYAEKLAEKKDAGLARAAAEKAYEKDFGDGTCPYLARALGRLEALDDTFEPFATPRDRTRYPSFSDLAVLIASPMLARVVKESP